MIFEGKAPIPRLLKAVHNAKDFFFVHVDAHHDEESSPEVKAIREALAPMVAAGNVRVEGVFDITWGGVSMLNAQLAMNEALLAMGKWDYLINLSSSDVRFLSRRRVYVFWLWGVGCRVLGLWAVGVRGFGVEGVGV